MRAASTLALALSAAVLAGCAVESPEASNQETASRAAEAIGLSDRDLTLQAHATPAPAIASPVELSRPILEPNPAPRPRPKVSPKRTPAPAPDPVPYVLPATHAVVSVPTAAAQVLPESVPVEEVAVGVGRELAPGKTVTIIPAASGSSASPEEPTWVPSGPGRSVIVGGGSGGGTCRPRGGVRGVGIAGRILIGLPGGRLR
jgi:hypothetical protein